MALHLPRIEIISQKDDITIFVQLMWTPLLLGGQAKLLGVIQVRTEIGNGGENLRDPRKDVKSMVEEKHLLVV